jgi:hypothetical protein
VSGYSRWIQLSDEAEPWRALFAAFDRFGYEDRKALFEPIFRASEAACARSELNPARGDSADAGVRGLDGQAGEGAAAQGGRRA